MVLIFIRKISMWERNISYQLLRRKHHPKPVYVRLSYLYDFLIYSRVFKKYCGFKLTKYQSEIAYLYARHMQLKERDKIQTKDVAESNWMSLGYIEEMTGIPKNRASEATNDDRVFLTCRHGGNRRYVAFSQKVIDGLLAYAKDREGNERQTDRKTKPRLVDASNDQAVPSVPFQKAEMTVPESGNRCSQKAEMTVPESGTNRVKDLGETKTEYGWSEGGLAKLPSVDNLPPNKTLIQAKPNYIVSLSKQVEHYFRNDEHQYINYEVFNQTVADRFCGHELAEYNSFLSWLKKLHEQRNLESTSICFFDPDKLGIIINLFDDGKTPEEIYPNKPTYDWSAYPMTLRELEEKKRKIDPRSVFDDDVLEG